MLESFFKHITIIGLGLIGGSLASAFKRKRIPAYITGVDYPEIVEKASALKIIDKQYTLDEIADSVGDADLVIVATPIDRILATIKAVAGSLKQGALVTDVGSTKHVITKAAGRILPKSVYFLGGHPMAGSEKGGISHCDPLLFENVIYVLTNGAPIPQELLDDFVNLVENIGAKTIFLSSDEHDRIAAVVSHIPQIMAVTMMNYAAKLNRGNAAFLKLGAGGFRDMTRIASSPFTIWKEILKTNYDNINSGLEQLIQELQKMKSLLAEPQMEQLFDEAARNRLSIPKDSRGFLRPHFDVFVVVEDKAGVIAKIANTLSAENINIKDIEVIKMREGDSGTMRLSFETEHDRENGMRLLNNNSFETQIKY